jgi:pantoate--beta-alanine ligase
VSVAICETVQAFRAACDAVRSRSERLALVPTMGALHDGHRALMREARRRADHVAVTIFVNPTQFGPGEDLERYPRDLAGDLAVCAAEGVETVFAPTPVEMYPEGERTRVRVEALTARLCGATRPTHFEGVTTVVTKLFAAAGPAIAVFGRKDYQQLKVIERMTRDLLLPIEIVGHPTVRETDGLALSSRNRYLSAEERKRALAIPRSLGDALRRFESGERRGAVLREPVVRGLAMVDARIDYVALADPETLEPWDEVERVGERALLAVAVRLGTTRLIDNVVLGVDEAPGAKV